ncbi:MAG: protein kinase [Burkholderiales bacterium]|jgi:serine/threonine-protein kinase|nr:protein kinase [Burkholderiales bacterium]
MPLPANIGRYHILEELGRGAHGAVFRALDPMIERHVAVKTISLALDPADREEFHSRFLKEAKAAGRLSHPNIVTVFDAGEEQDFAYIVMELLSGVSVREMLPPGKPLPAQLWVSIAVQVADGLACAHAAGVVHRDIKPGNIVVGGDGRVRITDFGIARVGGSTTGTQGGMILGSPRYMSPEQIQGFAVDPRADLFSLGAVMYEMSTGSAPFGGDTTDLATLMRAIVRTDPAPPASLAAAVSPELERVILRALAKRPQDRPQSAVELAQALRDAVKPIERGAAVAHTIALDATVKIPAPPRLDAKPDGATASRFDATTVKLAPFADTEPQSFDDFASRLLSDLDAFSVPPEELLSPPASRAAQSAEPRFPDVACEEAGAHVVEPAPAGLLAELAREAQRLREDASTRAAGAPDRVTEEARALDRRMRELFAWLNEFVRHLNTIKPPVARVYPLLNLGVFRGLGWQRGLADYRTRMVAGEHLVSRVNFSCTLAGSGELEAEREGPAIEKLHWQLFDLNVPFTTEEFRNSRGIVDRVRYRMPFEVRMAAVFECDEAARSVRLYTKNVQRFGAVDYHLAPDMLVPAMFEEFGKLVLGKPDRFFAWADFADPVGLPKR